MSTAQILALGAVSGLTIFIGLPMGRVHDVAQGFKAFLSATATGILLFLFWDVLKEAVDPVESALNASHWGRFSWLSALAFGGFALGLLSLVYYDAWMKARRRKSFLGPGAASATELERSHFTGLTPARWLALFIASGIGLHNFSEGLAIGQAGAKGTLSLAYVLVIGFGLHNATEGFGIVAPLAGDSEPPSWRWTMKNKRRRTRIGERSANATSLRYSAGGNRDWRRCSRALPINISSCGTAIMWVTRCSCSTRTMSGPRRLGM